MWIWLTSPSWAPKRPIDEQDSIFQIFCKELSKNRLDGLYPCTSLRIPSPVVCIDHPNTDLSCSPIAATSSPVLSSRSGSRLNDLNVLYLDPVGNPLGRLMSSPQRWLRVCMISSLDAWWGSGRFIMQISVQEEGGMKSERIFEFLNFATVTRL